MPNLASVFWFTGLSGSGKSSIANTTKALLTTQGFDILIIDGDDVRKKRHNHLGFSRDDILTNNRLICRLCEANRNNYDLIFVPIISPYREGRYAARQRLKSGFYEVFVDADLETVIQRDPKGLYDLARVNKITNMIGFHDESPYEQPNYPDLRIPSGVNSEAECIKLFVDFIIDIHGEIKPKLAKRK